LTTPAFLIPLLITIAWIIGIYYSLTDFDLRYGPRNYIGLGNYIYLLTKDMQFWGSLGATLKYTVLALILEVPLSFMFALLLDGVSGRIGRVARTVIMAPLCISPVVATIMWKIMMGPTQGILNHGLSLIGLPKVDWFGDPQIAMFSLILIDMWLFVPFVTLIFIGGLQSLPKAPYEAAQLDGASPFFVFRKLTLPLMQPFVMIALLFRAADSLNAFDTIYASTKGGPMRVTYTLNVMAYDNVMRFKQLGYGLAIMMITYFIAYAVVKRLMTFWPQ
jgi:multiple sugar transport system permease protein